MFLETSPVILPHAKGNNPVCVPWYLNYDRSSQWKVRDSVFANIAMYSLQVTGTVRLRITKDLWLALGAKYFNWL